MRSRVGEKGWGILYRNEKLEKPEVQEKTEIMKTLSKKGNTFSSPLKVMTRIEL